MEDLDLQVLSEFGEVFDLNETGMLEALEDLDEQVELTSEQKQNLGVNDPS